MPRTSPPRKDKNRVPRQKRELPPAPVKEAERVAKVVARAGLGSRREIEDWIEAGRVAVNGVVLTSPAVTVTPEDAITVDGEPLPERERTRLFLYHKPKGVVTTNRDPEGRTTLFEILPSGLPRLVSVGRLDLNSEGLLLLTNDGGLARVLELPETGWLRRYRVRANGEVDQAKLDTLLRGITVDGVEYGPIEAELDRVQGANAWITVSLREGKNREVRNVLATLGLQVNRLIRISYGPFQLGEIPEGSIEEVRTRVLRDQIGADLSAAAGADFEGPLVEREVGEAPPRPAYRPAGKRQEAAEKMGGLKAPARREARRRDEDFDAPVEDVIHAPAGPRARRRISDDQPLESRGTVADRKGRTVKVERVVSPKSELPARTPRAGGREGTRDFDKTRGPRSGPRRFEKPGEEAGARPFRGGRNRDEASSERPRRSPSEGKERPFGRSSFRDDGRPPRRERPADDGGRPYTGRSASDADRPRRPRPEADGPQRRDRSASNAPRRSGDDGGPKRSGARRPEGERRFGEDRPQRAPGDKPFRPRGDKPEGRSGGAYGDKPAGRGGPRRPEGERRFGEDRPQRAPGDKPFRPRGDKPEGRSGGAYGDKPAGRGGPRRPEGERRFGEDRPQRAPGDKPFRPRGDKPEGRSGGAYGDKPAGRGGSFGGKPGGKPAGKPAGERGGSFGGKPGGRPGGDKPRGAHGGGKPGGRPTGGKPAGPRGKR